MEVKITSSEMIKPYNSSVSPHFNLSLLDQLAPPVFISIILYYPRHQMGKDTTIADISGRLKTSLSQILVRFYPLAGRLDAANDKDIYQIECNDQGVEFYEAKVADLRLDDFLKNPNYPGMSDLVPCNHTCSKYSGREDGLLAVQANFFDCGGLALGVSFSHLIADGATFATFLKSWASTTDEGVSPIDLCYLFPHLPGMPRSVFPSVKNPTWRRFVLDELNLAALRRKSSGAPTRVEAATALVSRCMAKATKKDQRLDGGNERCFVVSHAVNLRRRMEPPLSDDAFGNIWIVISTPPVSQFDLHDGRLEMVEELDLSDFLFYFVDRNKMVEEVDLSDFLFYFVDRNKMRLRKAFKKVDATLAMELQGPERLKVMENTILSVLIQTNKETETEVFIFSSWCRFPFYEVNFGWGKPGWVSLAMLPYRNLCVFLDQKEEEGDGIEMWISMEDQEMAKFEKDPELLSFISLPM